MPNIAKYFLLHVAIVSLHHVCSSANMFWYNLCNISVSLVTATSCVKLIISVFFLPSRR